MLDVDENMEILIEHDNTLNGLLHSAVTLIHNPTSIMSSILLWIDENSEAGNFDMWRWEIFPPPHINLCKWGALLKLCINPGALPVGLNPPKWTHSIVGTQALRQQWLQVSKWSYGRVGPWNVTRLGPHSRWPLNVLKSPTERLWDTGPVLPERSRRVIVLVKSSNKSPDSQSPSTLINPEALLPNKVNGANCILHRRATIRAPTETSHQHKSPLVWIVALVPSCGELGGSKS